VSGVESVAKLVRNNNDDKIPSNAQEVKDILETVAPQIRGNLINADYTASNFLITIVPMEDDPLEDLKNRLNLTVTGQPEDTSAVLTGFPVIRLKLVHAVTGGRNEMTAIGIFFIFGALLLLFRFRILRAIMATLPIVMIIGWAGLFMYIFGIAFTPATATFGALIMGIGVEFTILLMMRYYEEREKGEIPGEAMSTAMAKIGRAVSVSAFTTIGGFAALLIARDFPILIDFGIVTMTNVFFALAASLLVLPSIIVWVDSRVQGNRAERFL